MPKNPPKNGYFYFMINYKNRAESRGRYFPGGMQEVAAAAAEEWRTLPQFRKDHFNQLAKKKRNDPRPNIPKRDERRYNSQGVSFAEIKMEKAKAEERLKQEQNYIEEFVNQMNLNELREKLLYLIHVNIFCKTDKDVFYPAEIGMVKFSLKGGIKRVFHRYIDPGEIAPGYSFEVKDHSDRTHKLTLPFVRSVEGTRDFPRLYTELVQFLSEDEIGGSIPPMFTMYDDILFNSSLNAVKGTFRTLWANVFPSKLDESWENVFKILPLPDMFFRLKNRCLAVTNPNTIAFPNVILAKKELQKDTYHYDLHTACKFHRDEDIIANCSQSFAIRWMYIIRDHCADLIGVDLFNEYALKTEVKREMDDYYDDSASTTGSDCWSKFSDLSSEFSKPDCAKPQIKLEKDNEDRYSESSDYKRRYSADEYSTGSVKREKYSDNCSASRSDERKNDDYDCKSSVTDSHKMEIKGQSTVVGCIKQEKTADLYSADKRIKVEISDASSSAANPIKKETHDPSIKQEKDVKQENQIKSEKDAEVKIKEEKDIKLEKDADTTIKKEKDVIVDPATGRIKVEKVDPGYSDW